MAGPYGDSAQIKRMLAVAGTTYSANDDARLDALNATISGILTDVLDQRTFGEPAADTTVLVWAEDSDVLVLDQPIRSITTVTVGGTVTGSTMTGGTVYSSTLWTPYKPDLARGEIRMLRLLSGGWWGKGVPVAITGQWAATDADAEVPDDIKYLVNYLVVEHFKREQLPVVTDDGVVVPRRDPWDDPLVKKILAKYGRARELVV